MYFLKLIFLTMTVFAVTPHQPAESAKINKPAPTSLYFKNEYKVEDGVTHKLIRTDHGYTHVIINLAEGMIWTEAVISSEGKPLMRLRSRLTQKSDGKWGIVFNNTKGEVVNEDAVVNVEDGRMVSWECMQKSSPMSFKFSRKLGSGGEMDFIDGKGTILSKYINLETPATEAEFVKFANAPSGPGK